MVMIMMDPGGEMMWDMKRTMHLRGPGAFSMTMPNKPPQEETTSHQQKQPSTMPVYTCPMHPEVQQDHPGQCPKCGMNLIPLQEQPPEKHREEAKATTYTCLMHPEVQQDHPGTCPKCGMDLVPRQEQSSESHQEEKKATMYTCPMHPEVQQDHPGTCPKCGMSLVPRQEASLEMQQANDHHEPHGDQAQEPMDMPGMDMSSSDQMDMSGLSARQHYEMMVNMAMSTAQLPWALVLGALSALLLIILVSVTPWPQSHLLPTQDATTMVGALLLSRYMIAFEGAAFLILAGIAGAVILGKRERFQELSQQHSPSVEGSGKQVKHSYSCPMHLEVQQDHPGTCPKCGMKLISQESDKVSSQHEAHGGHV
jgi:hypothetical protein